MTVFAEELIRAAKKEGCKPVSNMVFTSIKNFKEGNVGKKKPKRRFISLNNKKVK